MYDLKDIQFEGKYDYDKITSAPGWGAKSTSTGIYRLLIRAGGKSLKKSHIIVRVGGSPDNIDKINEMAEAIVKQMDAGEWDGRHNVTVK